MLVHPPKKKIRKNYYKSGPARQRAHRLHRLKNTLKCLFGVLAVAAMSFAFIFGYDLLTQSGTFKATQVKVEGVQRLSEREVMQQAGVSKGSNIFSVNLTAARKRLLAHPWIAEAEISREIPAGIHIRIQEEQPLAIIDLNRKFILNTQGRIFKEWETTDAVNLPMVSGLDFSDLNVDGMPFSRPFKAVMSVLRLGQEPNSVIAIGRIRQVDIDRDIGLTIHLNNNLGSIKLGYDNYAGKYKRLQEVLFYLKSGKTLENLRSIDLNNPDRIVVHINTEASSAKSHKEV